LWNHTPPNEDHKGEPDKDGFKPNVREVWFRGQHSDIGGGANPPKEKNDVASYTALSNITLRWMVQQCIEHHATGIIFDYETMKTYRQVKVLEEREPPTEKIKKNQTDEAYRKQQYERSAELDRIDIKHQPCETITWTSGWNFLEFWPSSRPVQTEPGKKTNVYDILSWICAFADQGLRISTGQTCTTLAWCIANTPNATTFLFTLRSLTS
jgi:hypothetical protein